MFGEMIIMNTSFEYMWIMIFKSHLQEQIRWYDITRMVVLYIGALSVMALSV